MRGHIQPRGKNTWRIFVSIGRDARGKYPRITETVHGTKGDAEKRLTEILAQYDKGELAQPKKMTVAQLCDKYLSTAHLRPRSKEWAENIIENHLKPALGNVPLKKLTTLQLEEYFSAKEKEGKLSDSTLNGHYRLLRAILNKATLWKLLPGNPLKGVAPPKKKRSGGTALSPAEAGRLLEAAKGRRYYAIYLTAAATGMRLGEILGLTWSNLDLESGKANVVQILLEGGRRPIFGDPKTEQSRRTVQLPPIVVEALQEVRKRQQAEIEAFRAMGRAYPYPDLVFTTCEGYPVLRSNLTRDFHEVIEKAGIPRIRIHDLRHSFASWLISEGVDITSVSAALGHSSPLVTLGTYAHLIEQMKSRPAQVVSDILKQDKNNGS